MENNKQIKNALVSVFHKEGLNEILKKLHEHGVVLYSTGGTAKFIKDELGLPVILVENLTKFPEMLGGRVKTLHPHVFGGILAERSKEDHMQTLAQYGIPEIDLVIVDLYPFQETLQSTTDQAEIIEKIDIGGISLIRAAAKNYEDVVVVASKDQYPILLEKLERGNYTTLEERILFGYYGFLTSSTYDTEIKNHFHERLHQSA